MSGLWEKVEVGGPDECWPWRASRMAKGYGRVRSPETGRPTTAHREVYRQTVGEIPDGSLVCHHCDNPPCCNPAHLYLGSPARNSADMVARGRQARGEGHPNAKLSDAVVERIRRSYTGKRGEQAMLARRHGVSPPTIHRILHVEEPGRDGSLTYDPAPV